MARTAFTPTVNSVYRNHGGGRYKAVSAWEVRLWAQKNAHRAMLEDLPRDGVWMQTYGGKAKWTCYCIGVGRYNDGSIDWDYSLRGFFMD